MNYKDKGKYDKLIEKKIGKGHREAVSFNNISSLRPEGLGLIWQKFGVSSAHP